MKKHNGFPESSDPTFVVWAYRLGFILSALTVLFTPGNAQAQYSSTVRRQLERVQSSIANYGFERSHNFTIDKMDEGENEYFTVTLDRGRAYMIAGACDQDCSDVDLKIFDENWNEIDADRRTDDLPVVAVTPSWTGRFNIKVTMYECSSEPCYYGVGIFER
jgi:hypothetical protein